MKMIRDILQAIPCSAEDREVLRRWLVDSLNGKQGPSIFFRMGASAEGKTAAALLIKAILPSVGILDGVDHPGSGQGVYVGEGYISIIDKTTITLHKDYHLPDEIYEPIRKAARSHADISKYLLMACISGDKK